MKLSEYKNMEALELLAEIIGPITEIMGDKEVAKCLKKKGKIATAVSIAIKNHKEAVFKLLASLDGKSVEEYECNVFTLPQKLLEILNDKELASFFGLQGQTDITALSGSATENTQEKE